MAEPTYTRLIAAQLAAALISSANRTGLPATDAVKIYSEVLEALIEAEKKEQSERAQKFVNSLGDEPPGG